MFPNQVTGPSPSPLQVSGPIAYLPAQSSSSSSSTSGWLGTVTTLMPWVVVIVALYLFAPVIKGMLSSHR